MGSLKVHAVSTGYVTGASSGGAVAYRTNPLTTGVHKQWHGYLLARPHTAHRHIDVSSGYSLLMPAEQQLALCL
jgi:hypothetical protein